MKRIYKKKKKKRDSNEREIRREILIRGEIREEKVRESLFHSVDSILANRSLIRREQEAGEPRERLSPFL